MSFANDSVCPRNPKPSVASSKNRRAIGWTTRIDSPNTSATVKTEIKQRIGTIDGSCLGISHGFHRNDSYTDRTLVFGDELRVSSGRTVTRNGRRPVLLTSTQLRGASGEQSRNFANDASTSPGVICGNLPLISIPRKFKFDSPSSKIAAGAKFCDLRSDQCPRKFNFDSPISKTGRRK